MSAAQTFCVPYLELACIVANWMVLFIDIRNILISIKFKPPEIVEEYYFGVAGEPVLGKGTSAGRL